MKHRNSKKCNCCECIWKRIISNYENIELLTIRQKRLSYTIENDKLIWKPNKVSQHRLYPQTKKNICDCLIARENGYGPTKYPGTAQSYKWALLNHKAIWLQ